ncbi:putative exosome complex exonuclease RRP44 [Caenorhabditis elegans]|uniref:Probable exosome complex exonuclease RRP44 n=1 Tax=Caenorhabditis elegans TaxID=6239 RepID=RRP44_CAEEL|nr:putative exosome complex exonuclease RRP44 [Caenorhabditis elegans]Q17632.2 RecName: Full=Probable exosome complex exonuclease RRP44; AltName: Full=Protein DIS3 homolog; AltName: Full=Ribosomal RNA-processing protein 44 [Caenorhabditis elegans]CAA94677.2 Probable exosome complex exonuclease RRP44 [Caenorhabditis elegans]|eukprot:NP_501835.2 Probable exosome complex exonuclease RRP44 [Caenorhabditis elegans]
MDLNVKQSGIHSVALHTTYFQNRSGKVYKRAEERYLRNDLSCGLAQCGTCKDFGTNPLLKIENPVRNAKVGRHALIVDSTSLIRFYDLFDSSLLRDLIVTQTVWEGVKAKAVPAYKKMNSLCYEDAKDRFHVFMNEFHCETFSESSKFEDLSRGEELLLSTALYLKTHWQKHNVAPVVLVFDEDSKKRMENHYQHVMYLKEYIQNLEDPGKQALLDQMAAYESSGNGNEKQIFDEYLSHDRIMEGIASGTIKRGNFSVSRENYREATVIIDDQLTSWFITGNNCNRAVNGDTVAVQLLPEDQWTAPEKKIRLRDVEEYVKTADDMGNEDEENDDENDEPKAKKSKKMTVSTAKVVGIIKRNWREYCGMLLPSTVKGARRHLFCPAERLIPRIRIETEQAETLSQQRIVVAIDHWPRDSKYPLGHYVRSIGEMGSRETENEVLLLEHDIPHAPFSESVLDCLPREEWEPDLTENRGPLPRVDLRDLTICSVDPLGCTDIDDALHCKQIGEDLFEVGVHIADVTHFVRPGTAIDDEAALRGTTVYLCDRRIDMLPCLLSSNLCSLRGEEERYAFSCIWTMTSSADIQSVKYHKSLIKSKAALTYEKAQEIIDDPKEQNDVALGLRGLMKLSKVLNARRTGNGALTLASSEVRFDMDWESRTPKKVMEKQHLDTHSMVEEFMLLANISVAEKILEEYPDCALLRRHPVPLKESYKPLVEAARHRGFEIIVESGKGLADSLNRCVDKKNPMLNRLLRMLTTRCMTQAVYFSAGTVPVPQYQHFGLACAIYTHFTSPIRRYADVIVHRLLAAAIGADDIQSGLLNQARCTKICTNINYRHKQAQYAGRASVQLNVVRYFKGKVETCEGFVMGVRNNGIQVFVPKYGLESIIVLQTSAASGTTIDVEEMSVKVNGDVVIKELEPVTVRISVNEKNQQRPRVELQLIKPAIPGLSVDFDLSSSEGLGL